MITYINPGRDSQDVGLTDEWSSVSRSSHPFKKIAQSCFLIMKMCSYMTQVFFKAIKMPNFFKKKMGSFKPIEKNEGKCVKNCETVIKALHTIATMLPKSHFIRHAKPIHTKITYKNYIFKIAYLKLASFN